MNCKEPVHKPKKRSLAQVKFDTYAISYYYLIQNGLADKRQYLNYVILAFKASDVSKSRLNKKRSFR